MNRVVCLAVGEYLRKWADCIKTQRVYCQRNGYAYDLIDEPSGGLHPKWQKFEYCRALLASQQSNVLLIDADAAINDAAPPFHQVVNGNARADIFCVLGRSRRPNSGVIMFRGGPGSCASHFLSTCLEARSNTPPPEDFVTAEGENGHFIHFLKQQPFSDRLCILDRRWNNTVPPPNKMDFITHYAGGPMRRLWLNQHPVVKDNRHGDALA